MSGKKTRAPADVPAQGRKRPATKLLAAVRTDGSEAVRRPRAAPASAVARQGKRAKGIGSLGGRLAAATRMARLRANRAAEERHGERR